MEIDRAIRGSSDLRLQTKYRNATYVIERAFALYQFDQIAFSFNGGKDSTVLLHLLRAGYYLHKEKVDKLDCMPKCPIRTIYFESPCAFPEINSFTYETATTYDLQLEIIHLDFKTGLENLLKEKTTRAIFLGTRISDPNAVGQEQFSPSSPGWPPFMRVNPILDWSYRDVWAFLLTCKVQYCSLYDKGYTSIGSIYDNVPNAQLCVPDTSSMEEHFKPAYLLSDGRSERAGRAMKLTSSDGSSPPAVSNGLSNVCSQQSCSLSASIIAVGDEILFGTTEDKIGATLCKKFRSIGWLVAHIAFVRNDVFLFGGLGPLHSDISLAGVAKAFGVRLIQNPKSIPSKKKIPNRLFLFSPVPNSLSPSPTPRSPSTATPLTPVASAASAHRPSPHPVASSVASAPSPATPVASHAPTSSPLLPPPESTATDWVMAYSHGLASTRA